MAEDREPRGIGSNEGMEGSCLQHALGLHTACVTCSGPLSRGRRQTRASVGMCCPARNVYYHASAMRSGARRRADTSAEAAQAWRLLAWVEQLRCPAAVS